MIQTLTIGVRRHPVARFQLGSTIYGYDAGGRTLSAATSVGGTVDAGQAAVQVVERVVTVERTVKIPDKRLPRGREWADQLPR